MTAVRTEGLTDQALARIREEFPILSRTSRGKPLVYLDNGATTQKPAEVIDTEAEFYRGSNANIHRGVYEFSERATVRYDQTREITAAFLGGVRPEEIVFTRGTTEGINLVAHSWLKPRMKSGDTVLVTELEHHSNIVPWQLAGATLHAIPVLPNGALDLSAAERMLADGPKLLAMAHVSNVLGTVNPVSELCAIARRHGVHVLVDGAQAVNHFPVDLGTLGADFYVFSSHKLYGPTGVGVLWARHEILQAMPPYQGGGDMIDRVTIDRTTYAAAPQRFEAGTPNIAGVIAFGAALTWISRQDREAFAAHEQDLLEYGMGLLAAIPEVTLVGTAPNKVAAMAFTLAGVHPHDLASLLDQDGICVRAGHHCTQPLHHALGVHATTRASVACYNSRNELDQLADGVRKALRMFA